MIDEKRYLGLLKALRAQRADAVLEQAGPEYAEFVYGREAGINAGLRLAEDILLDMMKDEKEKEAA